MAIKNKNSQIKIQDRLQTAAAQLGLVLMAGAATMMTVETLHAREASQHKIVVPNQPSTMHAELQNEIGGGHERREREETGPHLVSYGAAQRTAARAGRA